MKKISIWWKMTPYKFLIGAILIIAIMIIYGVVIHNINFNYNERGSFGDQYGAVNTFFTAITFLGILLTYINTVNDRKKDLIDKQKEAFENRFFFLLENLEKKISLTSQLSINDENKNLKITSDFHTQTYTSIKTLSEFIIDKDFNNSNTIVELNDYFSKLFVLNDINTIEFFNKYKENYKSNYSVELFNELTKDVYLKCIPDFNAFISICEFLNKEYTKRLESGMYLNPDKLTEEVSVYIDLIKSVANSSAICLYFYIIMQLHKEIKLKPIYNLLFLRLNKLHFIHIEHYDAFLKTFLDQQKR